ncbi:PREDICTED: (+)-neomenthol dehydrogenase-like isoform X1 [Nicotiana attenuata]|uniref:Short-chain dehydrogenase/reductase n=1 Tax=Nicotiana attenuata TaxID=49451 RepID=A0A1J6KNK8_NICAT|nr:PREDICTED: (+)-neomenthol dehydrogenase-like isoform X1 [Nicotiana attenuata]OIT26456.1 (+)-neomenthol dehydrogenase [Nicotiana attenuata]
MAEASNFLATQRIAVVTGANKGIGLEICRQLASKGIVVILTARDEKKGAEAIDILKECGLSNYVIFHKLDVTDPSTIAQLKDFIKARFGKLDILVNNAAVVGVLMDKDVTITSPEQDLFIEKLKVATQTYDVAEECLKTNYYGAKQMIQELLPLLQFSDSPRIVNVSSLAGKLEHVRNEWAVGVLSDAENLTEDRVDEVLNAFLQDLKDGLMETEKWSLIFPAYTLSKAAMNAYTRILAKKYPSFLINCVCPGYVKTDMTINGGKLSVEEGAESPVWLALLPEGGPSGIYFNRKEVTPF